MNFDRERCLAGLRKFSVGWRSGSEGHRPRRSYLSFSLFSVGVRTDFPGFARISLSNSIVAKPAQAANFCYPILRIHGFETCSLSEQIGQRAANGKSSKQNGKTLFSISNSSYFAMRMFSDK